MGPATAAPSCSTTLAQPTKTAIQPSATQPTALNTQRRPAALTLALPKHFISCSSIPGPSESGAPSGGECG